jgi:hypothetical protein
MFSYMANSSVAVKSNNYPITAEWKSIRAKGNNTVTTRIYLKIHHNPLSLSVYQL